MNVTESSIVTQNLGMKERFLRTRARSRSPGIGDANSLPLLKMFGINSRMPVDLVLGNGGRTCAVELATAREKSDIPIGSAPSTDPPREGP